MVELLPKATLAKQKKDAAAAAKPKKAAVPRAKKMYVPEQGSGGYAILIAMHTAGGNERMNQHQIVEIAEDGGWCTSSFHRKSVTDHFTAWSSLVAPVL